MDEPEDKQPAQMANSSENDSKMKALSLNESSVDEPSGTKPETMEKNNTKTLDREIRDALKKEEEENSQNDKKMNDKSRTKKVSVVSMDVNDRMYDKTQKMKKASVVSMGDEKYPERPERRKSVARGREHPMKKANIFSKLLFM